MTNVYKKIFIQKKNTYKGETDFNMSEVLKCINDLKKTLNTVLLITHESRSEIMVSVFLSFVCWGLSASSLGPCCSIVLYRQQKKDNICKILCL